MGSSRQRCRHSIEVSRAIDGFLKFKLVEGRSENTIATYRRQLDRFCEWAGDEAQINEIESEDIQDFLYWLKVDYKPQRLGGGAPKPLSDRTINHYHGTLKTFFNWAEGRKLTEANPVANIAAPKYQSPPVNPLGKDEIKALLKAAKLSRTVDRKGYKTYKFQKPNHYRDRAILLTLLDTGLRSSELCDLVIGDLNPQNGEIKVRQGKGGKDRTVFVGRAAQAAIWDYMLERDDESPEAPLFVTMKGKKLKRDTLLFILKRLAERAGVEDVYTHRFRHTFAVSFLKNGGNIFALQRLLGHSTLTMVNHYLNIAKADLEESHRTSSPVDNWGL